MLPDQSFQNDGSNEVCRACAGIAAIVGADEMILALFNFDPYINMDLLGGRPILVVCGTEAHSRVYSEECYAKAYEPKEMYWVEGAGHCDLYDDKTKIPFTKLADFFGANLRK